MGTVFRITENSKIGGSQVTGWCHAERELHWNSSSDSLFAIMRKCKISKYEFFKFYVFAWSENRRLTGTRMMSCTERTPLELYFRLSSPIMRKCKIWRFFKFYVFAWSQNIHWTRLQTHWVRILSIQARSEDPFWVESLWETNFSRCFLIHFDSAL